MGGHKFTPAQIQIAVQARLRGMSVADIAQQVSAAESTIRLWADDYAGMSTSAIAKRRRIEDKATKLPGLYRRILSERKAWRRLVVALNIPTARRNELFGLLMETGLVSGPQARRLVGLHDPRTPARKFERDEAEIARMMRQHLADHPGHGFKTMFHQCLAGKVGQVRAARLYAAHRLQMFHRNTSRVYPRFKVALVVPPQTDHTWSIDFVYCHCAAIHRLRVLTVLDDFSRECLAIQSGQGRAVTWLLAALSGLLASRGVPRQIRCDNGPEFRSAAFQKWAAKHGITILHTAPYRPNQNGYFERFNLTLRVDFLNWHRSTSLATFQVAADRCRYQYNHDRPHQSLGWLTPAAYAHAHRPLAPLPGILQARARRTTRWGTKKGQAPAPAGGTDSL